ncbi:MAG: hypothetical protein ACOX1Z_02625 [Candidatus Ratteibacteria bacterium]
MKKYILPVEMLRKECNLKNFNFTSTEEIHPLEGLNRFRNGQKKRWSSDYRYGMTDITSLLQEFQGQGKQHL